MESRLLGIPLVIWFFLLGLVVLIGGPMWVLHQQEMRELTSVAANVKALQVSPTAIPTATPTATPSATPTVMFKKLPLRSVHVTVAPTK